jgi:tripartite-type tricarboxylate transporter receptor subunit TctC
VVVNKPGGAGMIGLQACAQAAPDGYTICTNSNVFLMPIEWEIANGRKPMVTKNDFVWIGAYGQAQTVIAVPYDSPWKTINDLIKDGKAKPGQYAFASGGMNSPTHLTVEVLMRTAGVKFRHVPYAGGRPSAAALVGKYVDFGAMGFVSALPLVQGNKLRILAVVSSTRYKAIPDIPTLKEFGIDHEFLVLSGISAPQKTPKPIVEKLTEIVKKVTEDKSFISTVEAQGDEVIFKSGDEMDKLMIGELERYARLFKQFIEEEKSKK